MIDAVSSSPPEPRRHEKSLLAALRLATQECHDRLEQNPLSQSLVAGTLTREGYEALLTAFWGVHAPIEAALSQAWPELTHWGFEPERRGRIPALAHDLRDLGLSDERQRSLPVCPGLPPGNGSFSALVGSLYVLEGSTLGGQVIVRGLRRSWGEARPAPHRFYGGYGTSTAELWRSFCRGLEAYGKASSPAERDQIVSAARLTFERIEDWLAHAARTLGTPLA